MKTLKTRQEFINESNIISCDEYFKDKNVADIPVDANISEQPEIYNGKHFTKFSYFGDCVNTVPRIWDATQMSQFCFGCKLYDINLVLNNLYGGDMTIPSSLMKHLNSENINDLGEIVCAIDDYQRIMFIYVTDLDKHFFFDCE